MLSFYHKFASPLISIHQEFIFNSRGMKLFTCSWMPAHSEPKGLVFLCHGYGIECSVSLRGRNEKSHHLNIRLWDYSLVVRDYAINKCGRKMEQAVVFDLQRPVMQSMALTTKAMATRLGCSVTSQILIILSTIASTISLAFMVFTIQFYFALFLQFHLYLGFL